LLNKQAPFSVQYLNSEDMSSESSASAHYSEIEKAVTEQWGAASSDEEAKI
jgi:hypothetical protein